MWKFVVVNDRSRQAAQGNRFPWEAAPPPEQAEVVVEEKSTLRKLDVEGPLQAGWDKYEEFVSGKFWCLFNNFL